MTTSPELKNGPADAHLDFCQRLREELRGRTRRNPKYSLRSFATALDLTPSFLSKLLNGKRPLTNDMLEKLTAKLGIPKAEVDFYRSPRTSTHAPATNFRRVELDQFSFIADWYHFAILELVALPSFDASPNWIAKELGITPAEAAEALERLIRLDFLDRDARGRVRNKSGNNTTIGPNVATPATRLQQKQILEKAIEALDHTPLDARSQTSLTLAIARERLPEARAAIAAFRRTMTSLLQNPLASAAPDSVYQLSVSFFPLTPDSLERRSK